MGSSPWGCKESDTTEQLNTHTHTHAHIYNHTGSFELGLLHCLKNLLFNEFKKS